MKRRELLISLGAATVLGGRTLRGQQTALRARVSIDWAAMGPKIPVDYCGFSYESMQLESPAFFSPGNKGLISIYRELTPHGVLRLGGNTSAFTTFTGEPMTGPDPLVAQGPSTPKTETRRVPVSTTAIDNLRGFLDATGWTCIYGLNMAQGTVENAVAEAAYVQKVLGPKLVCFQLGNEPDAWPRRYEPANWGPVDYLNEWKKFRAVLVEKIPGFKLAGPDISNKMPFLTAFAAEIPRQVPELIMLTAHYYAMGPAGSPGATLDQLLISAPNQRTGDIDKMMAMARPTGLPLRMTEVNSCWAGGQPGVSDTHASALWCGDMMLQFAKAGCRGVNMHGGGNGFYTPIAGSMSAGFVRRPEFYGMLLAQQFVGSILANTRLQSVSDRVTAYAASGADGKKMAVVFNKTVQPLQLEMSGDIRWGRRGLLLTGPSLESKDGTVLSPVTVRLGAMEVPPYSALMITTY